MSGSRGPAPGVRLDRPPLAAQPAQSLSRSAARRWDDDGRGLAADIDRPGQAAVHQVHRNDPSGAGADPRRGPFAVTASAWAGAPTGIGAPARNVSRFTGRTLSPPDT